MGHSELRDIGSYELKASTNTRCTSSGIMLPFSHRLTVDNVTLINFDENGGLTILLVDFANFFFVNVHTRERNRTSEVTRGIGI